MTRAMALYTYLVCAAGLLCAAGCDRPAGADPVPVIDLLAEFDRAERRPPGGSAAVAQVAGQIHPAIVMPVPSRITWRMPLPRHGTLNTYVALDRTSTFPARLRIGISDARVYEGLSDVTISAGQSGWTRLRADLSPYAGWKWSLFYRPDRIVWNVVLAADAVGGGPAVALWGSPEIVTDARSAREYVERRRRLHLEAQANH